MSQAAPAFVDRAPVELPHPQRMRILGAVMVGIFLAALDQTVVGTALPRIVTDLKGNELYTWVITAYLLTSTISGPLYGKISDLFGRRPVFLFGIAVFMLGSLLSGFSQSMPWLIVARGVQGLGAGALFPIALAVIGDIFSPSERGRYQGLFGAVFGLSILIGPAIGGLITDTIGWHWVFFINIPIGAAVFYVVFRTLPLYHLSVERPRIDYLGAALFTAALVPILLGLTNKAGRDWTDPLVGGLIVLGAIVLLVFFWVESRAPEPIVPLNLFRHRAFTISISATFLAAIGFFATVVFLPRWFQVVNHSSATESGYQILPLLGGLIFSAIASGQIVARTGRFKALILFALLMMAIGLFGLSTMRVDTPIPILWAWMFVTGLGVGPTFAVFILIVQASVPVAQLGAGTSSLTFFQQVGGTVGLAITGTIFASTMTNEIPGQLAAAQVPPEIAGGLAQGGLDPNLLSGVGDLGAAILAGLSDTARAQVEPFIGQIVHAIYAAFSIATSATFVPGIACALLAGGLVLLYKEVPIRAEAGVAVPAGAEAAPGDTVPVSVVSEEG
jgi:EmrB/QacA subfamily drug resistance transporter